MPLLLFHPTFDDIGKGCGKIRPQIMPLVFIKSSLQLLGGKSGVRFLRGGAKMRGLKDEIAFKFWAGVGWTLQKPCAINVFKGPVLGMMIGYA